MTAGRYRKKPIEVEAILFDGTNSHDIVEFIGGGGVATVEQKMLPGPGRGMREGILIRTLEGVMRAEAGWWIVKGIAGEFYPCRGDVFEATYEAVR